MSNDQAIAYRISLECAHAAVVRGDRDGAMHSVRQALQAANTSRDARYRRATLRALNFVRALPVVTA